MVPTRPLGRNGPPVQAIGFGAMSLGGTYSVEKQSDADKVAVLQRAWEIGERFWDTADIYMDAEDRIGDWFRQSGKRADIFLATKFGIKFDPEKWTIDFESSPDYIRAACARSLKRLGTDYIDLYYCHRADGKVPIETVVKTMVELKNEGKIRHLGLSEVSAASIRRAHAVHPIAAVQVDYSPFCLDIEFEKTDVLRTCRELGISIVAYGPTGHGLLTGKIKSFEDLPADDFRRTIPRYSPENFPKITALVDKINAVAARHGCTNAQVCLAWLLAQGEDIIPIPGTKTIKYLEENTAAAEIELSADEVAELRRFSEATVLEGDRYPASMMSVLLGDTPELETA